VAQKYQDSPKNRALLAGRIINGSVGTWGEHAMSAHPNLAEQDAELMVEYILSLNDPQPVREAIPLAGAHTLEAPPDDPGQGGYLLRAAYTDNGAGNLAPIASEKIIALRNPVLDPERADVSQGFQILTTPSRSINVIEDQAYLGYRQLDLTGIREVAVNAEAPARTNSPGGIVELRLDSPTGALLGSTDKINVVEIDYRAELEKLRKAWEVGGKKGPRPGFRTVRELFKPTYVIPLGPVEGSHDVYFVVRNPEAREGEILIQFDGVEFKNAGPSM